MCAAFVRDEFQSARDARNPGGWIPIRSTVSIRCVFEVSVRVLSDACSDAFV